MLLSVTLLAACGEKPVAPRKPNPNAKKVKIGVIAPMTGSSATQGKHGLKGIKSAMHFQPALFNGDIIELVVEDDKNNPELTVKALKKLVEEDKVSGILILSSSQAVLEVNKVADSHATPLLALIASHPDIATKSNYVNQLCFDNTFQGKVAALFAMDELLIEKAAVFVDSDNPHSKSLAEIFKKKFQNIGGKMTVPVLIDSEMENLQDTLKYLKKQNTELLYMPVDAEEFIKISKKLREIDWDPVRMGSDGLLSDVFAKHQEDLDLLEGIIGIDFYAANVPLTDYGKGVLKSYVELFNTQGNTYTAAGVEGYAVLFNALSRSGDFNDRAEVNQKMRGTINFDGFMGKITIQPNGKALRHLFVNTIKNGELNFLVKVY